MVGLSVILENFKEKKCPQLIIKGLTLIKPPSTLSGFSWTKNPSGFLDYCFLCKQKLSPSKDLYMYKGDMAFCSVECRCRQIFMDEDQETQDKIGGATKDYNCSLAAIKASSSSSSSSPSAKIHWFT
ncbi:FCS-Like Zinc finger 1-like [Henckelia pumila]|uniref:FCS-Like Zinc finger 1-like n=1 Tax=Henckelia pumila TaxID=405737 RepID=UPI003C6DBB57